MFLSIFFALVLWSTLLFDGDNLISGSFLSNLCVPQQNFHGYDDIDRVYMRRAIELAAQATGKTSPNPCVGCVIVVNGTVVGEGWHEKAGSAHAEVNALKMAGVRAAGGTAYVSLEPCNHYGRTPPCTHALIR
jgi:deoxycytidylate deaminase